jgi:competence protein ComEA
MADKQRTEQPAKDAHVGEFLRNSHPRLGETRLRADGLRPLLRRADQAAVASLVAFALVGMTAYWFVHGGHRGELIEIDRAEPLTARFLVDINSADWPELAELPDIGETLARRIVESRAAAGSFADHDDLLRVRGIGPRTLEKMQPYLLPLPDQEDVAGGAKPQLAL